MPRPRCVVFQDLLADAAAAAAQQSESSQGGELFKWVEVDENAACGLCYTRWVTKARGWFESLKLKLGSMTWLVC
jgi:hypothetical protein